MTLGYVPGNDGCPGACSACGTKCQVADLRAAEARVEDMESGLNETYRRLSEQALARQAACAEHADRPSMSCARCQARAKEAAAVARFRGALVAALRGGWPCRLPGGDIYGPYEDALAMLADALEKIPAHVVALPNGAEQKGATEK